MAADIADDLDDVWIEELLHTADRMAGGGDGSVGIDRQFTRHLIDQFGLDEGFVALDIDDQDIVVPAALRNHFSDAIRAAGVVDARHDSSKAMPFDGSGHFLVVGRDQHFRCAASRGALGHSHHHRLAGNISKRLAGKPAGSIAGGNDDPE
jgi:hypothetical protein